MAAPSFILTTQVLQQIVHLILQPGERHLKLVLLPEWMLRVD